MIHKNEMLDHLEDKKYIRANYILNWKQRIESVSGLTCIHLSEVLKNEVFPYTDLVSAYDEDRFYFKGLVEDLNNLL